MKKIKARFVLGIGYSSASQKEDVEFEFTDDYTEQEIEDEISAELENWANNFIDTGFEILSVENIEEE